MERMKRVLSVLLCLVLVFGMLPMSALAAPGRGKGNSNKGNKGNTTVVTEPTQPATDDTQLLAIENEDTVANADLLRASTYVLTSSNDVAEAVESGTYDIETLAEAGDSTVLKYFNVTMYNYDQDKINNATHKLEYEANPDLTMWNGLYFSGGSPSPVAYTVVENSVELYSPTVNSDGTVTVEDGTYYIYSSANECYMTGETNSNGWWNYATFIPGQTSQSLAETMTITAVSGGYTIQNSSKEYLQIPSNNNGIYVTDSNVLSFEMSGNSLLLKDNGTGLYLNALGDTEYDAFGGWTNGSPLTLYAVVEGVGTDALSFGAWNFWSKNSGSNNNGQKTWTGLVEPQLDANKDIIFTVPDGGIFNSDATVKDIYTGVQMPFFYADGKYTFDAQQHGVYFLADATQGSGSVGSNTRLYFDEGNPQGWSGMYYGDGSKKLWAPFNTNEDDTSEANIDYHFGMRTTIPFTMTTNGRINEKVADSEPIVFSFSGDDDVWVFIDGQLVIDLGGIHNRLDAEINFATNTITYSASNDAKDDNDVILPTGSYNDADFELTQTLFGGAIAQDRATFAATDSHELTIFYLERGKGSSNCKIEFNLPMKDTVTVTKRATKSWEESTQTESVLTAKEQAAVDNIDFGFTLIKSEDGGETFVPVANTNYKLVNENGQVISVPSTDANGHFYLKNGQSARFVTTFTTSGVIYYVVEDDVSDLGFLTPDFNFAGTAAGGFVAKDNTYTSADLIGEQVLELDATENKSYAVTVKGSDESEDSIVFICENYLDANLPNPSARPAEDRIVIDYGLPVIIDVLKNDLYRGDTIEIIGVYGADATLTDAAKETVRDQELTLEQIVEGADSAPVYGTVVFEKDKITYQLTEQLTGVEVLNYVVKVTGTVEKNELTHETVSAYSYGIAQVYIIPATTMYYEENFASLISYTNDGGAAWQLDLVTESAYTSANQEPGVVGTVGDSPYGSDVAYLNDSHDSNGTSKYANTETKAAKFEYTFTGTSSSIFARTGKNTGMMKITIVNTVTGEEVFVGYRNTKYVESENSEEIDFDYLYNIPVYSTGNLGYGTYHVTVVIGRGTDDNKYGTEFWLDGIRVYQPLDDTDANYDKATSAYATDAEANMVNETLRDKLLDEASMVEDENGEFIPVWTEGGKFVLLTDIEGKMTTAEEYQSIGPKEEVYLYNGQTVTFSLYNWDPNTNKIYLGIKAPTGSGTVTIGSTTLQINNATDCYYDISDYAYITTDEDGIKTATFQITSGDGSLISVTNIKVSGQFEFTIIDGNVDEDYYPEEEG